MGDLEEAATAAAEQGADSRLNSTVALLVAIAATLMALNGIKAGNVGQAMAQAQSHSIDAWSFYQAKSTKQNLAEATLDTLRAMRIIAPPALPGIPDLDKEIEFYKQQVARYEREKGEIKAQAEAHQAEYDRLNLRDDQYDLSDAGFSVAIALLGITALTRKRWLLGLVAVFMSVGLFFAVAAFMKWNIHPDFMMSWL